MPAPFDLKEQVRTAVDIVDLIGREIQLHPAGANRFKGLCPWHDDSKPSLQVNRDRQSWKCWVCDIGGDAFEFVQRREGVGFRESLEILAERAGIEIRQSGPAPETGTAAHLPTLYRAAAWAEQQFCNCLKSDATAQSARDYLVERGITAESQDRYRVGFAPESWSWLLDRGKQAGFSPLVLEAVGLLAQSREGNRHYDRFRGRVIFPIYDVQDRPIAFGGRVMPGSDDPAKYINSPETRIFHKSEQLYGLSVARESIRNQRHAVVVEGYTDVVMCRQHGLENVVAVLGTALGAAHIKQLRQRNAERVTLLLDGDDAGRRRANEVLELFVSSPLELRIVTLPDNLDPCDYADQHGVAALQQLIDSAPDALSHKLRQATQHLGRTPSVHDSARAMDEILRTLAKAPTYATAAATNPWTLRSAQVVAQLSRMFRIDEVDVRKRLGELRKSKPNAIAVAPSEVAESTAPKIDTHIQPWDQELLGLVLRHPVLAQRASAAIQPDDMGSPTAGAIWRAMISLLDQDELPEFERVMAATENPEMKSLIVSIDAKHMRNENDPDECLDELLQAYQVRAAQGESRDDLARLQDENLTEEEETALLLREIARARERQGISVPTDG